ncbi:MAG: hypothetical protein ACO3RV_05540 [Luteolibacter sp.]
MAIWLMRLSAALLVLKWLLAPASVGFLLYALIRHDPMLLIDSLILLFAFCVVLILQWIIAHDTRCPLCHVPVMLSKKCAKNTKARRLIFSYRLRVATQVGFLGRFRCPYCGEVSLLEKRKRRG